MTKKIKTSFTLTESASKLLKLLAKKLGVSQTAIIEIAVRRLADKEGVSLDD